MFNNKKIEALEKRIDMLEKALSAAGVIYLSSAGVKSIKPLEYLRDDMMETKHRVNGLLDHLGIRVSRSMSVKKLKKNETNCTVYNDMPF